MKTYPIVLSDEEHADLKHLAGNSGKSIKRYIFDCIFSRPIAIKTQNEHETINEPIIKKELIERAIKASNKEQKAVVDKAFGYPKEKSLR